MLWIKLHEKERKSFKELNVYENNEVLVSYATICSMRALKDGGTEICITGADLVYEVTETPEEIEELGKTKYTETVNSIIDY